MQKTRGMVFLALQLLKCNGALGLTPAKTHGGHCGAITTADHPTISCTTSQLRLNIAKLARP
jgi:hypothetical protein